MFSNDKSNRHNLTVKSVLKSALITTVGTSSTFFQSQEQRAEVDEREIALLHHLQEGQRAVQVRHVAQHQRAGKKQRDRQHRCENDLQTARNKKIFGKLYERKNGEDYT